MKNFSFASEWNMAGGDWYRSRRESGGGLEGMGGALVEESPRLVHERSSIGYTVRCTPSARGQISVPLDKEKSFLKILEACQSRGGEQPGHGATRVVSTEWRRRFLSRSPSNLTPTVDSQKEDGRKLGGAIRISGSQCVLAQVQPTYVLHREHNI